MFRRVLFGPPKGDDGEGRPPQGQVTNGVDESSPLLQQEPGTPNTTTTTTTAYTVAQGPPPRLRPKRGGCCRSCCAFCLLNFLLIIIFIRIVAWVVPPTCESSTSRLPFCPDREPTLPPLHDGGNHRTSIYSFGIDIPFLDLPPTTKIIDDLTPQYFPAGLRGSIQLLEGDLYQSRPLMIYVRISGAEWNFEDAVTLSYTKYPAGYRPNEIKLSSPGKHKPKNPMTVEVFGFLRPDTRSWGNLIVDACSLNITFTERPAHPIARTDIRLKSTHGNIHGILAKPMIYHQTSVRTTVMSDFGKITGDWSTHLSNSFYAGDGLDINLFVSGDSPPFTEREVSLTATKDVKVNMDFNQTSYEYLTNQTMAIYSYQGNINAKIIHGGFTNLTAPKGDINATLLPYWVEAHDVFTPAYRPRLESRSKGNTNIHVKRPVIDEKFKTNPMNQTTSRHFANGTLELWYPEEWGGSAEVASTLGTASVKGNLKISKQSDGLVNATRKGDSDLWAKGWESATVIFDDID